MHRAHDLIFWSTGTVIAVITVCEVLAGDLIRALAIILMWIGAMWVLLANYASPEEGDQDVLG